MPESVLGATRIDGPEQAGRVLIVGEINPYGADSNYALYHLPERAAGHRLQSMIMGVDARHWYLPMWRTNLCVGAWDKGEAADRAATLIGPESPWRTMIMLGQKVMKAFAFHTWQDASPFTSYTAFRMSAADWHSPGSGPDAMFRFVYLPHPSGRNTVWTTPKAVPMARGLLGEVLPDIPWGSL